MRKLFLPALLIVFSSFAFSQQNLPSQLKGNWLNAADSIEWLYSFQPGFAVCETLFWEYKTINRNGNEYKLLLASGKEEKLLSVKVIDNTSLQITAEGKSPIRCTNQKARKPDFRNYDTQEFKEPILVDDTATISGFIEDYDPTIFSKTGSVEYYSVLSHFEDNSKTEFKIQPDGRFMLKFRMFNPQNVWLSIDGSTQTTVFAKPGKTHMVCFNKLLKGVTVDSRKWKEISDWQVNHYMGEYGLLSEELLLLEKYFYYAIIPVQERVNSRENMQQLEYESWRLHTYEKEISGLDSLGNAMNCSAKARQVMNKTALFQLLENLLGYPFKNAESFQLSQKYIDRLPVIDSPSEQNLLTSQYVFYINYLDFVMEANTAPQRNYSEQLIQQYDYVMDKFNSDLTGQMYAAYQILLIHNSIGLDSVLVEWAKQRITNPVLINYLLEAKKAKEELKLKYSAYDSGTLFIDSIASDKNSDAFFMEILKKFEGKVVYIDFWADWCSPCRAEFEPAIKLKQDYADKDIVFLYLGISCKKNLWEAMIKEKQIEGYHYWLNKDQGQVMYKKFNFNGIPHFLLVDKNGAIMDSDAPRTSSKVEIRAVLDGLLK